MNTGFVVLEFSGAWILDCNQWWNSGFLELYSEFQSPGFWIPQAKFSRIPESRCRIQILFVFGHGSYMRMSYSGYWSNA